MGIWLLQLETILPHLDILLNPIYKAMRKYAKFSGGSEQQAEIEAGATGRSSSPTLGAHEPQDVLELEVPRTENTADWSLWQRAAGGLRTEPNVKLMESVGGSSWPDQREGILEDSLW